MGRWSDICTEGESFNMNEVIVGFYLVMVTILPSGEVQGEVLNHFSDPYTCIEEGNWEEENAPYGVGFVCLEDVANIIIEKDLDG